MSARLAPEWRFATALGLLVGGAVFPAIAQSVEPTLVERTGVFASRDLTESSGVAASRQYPGILWTHNDSGHDPVVFATNLAGENLGGYWLTVVNNVDWEDIAVGPCPKSDRDCLYVADTGDNLETRAAVSVLIFPEPAPPSSPTSYERLQAHVLHVRYPDRAHDIEALAVTPQGEIYLITKGRSGPIQVFRIPRAAARRDTVTAIAAGVLPITPLRSFGQVVTGSAFSPRGSRLVVRTYTQLFFFRKRSSGSFTPSGSPCWIGLREPQGEGVDFLDQDTQVLTSESARGQPGGIWRIRCPPARD